MGVSIADFEGLLKTIKEGLRNKKGMLSERDKHTRDYRARELFYDVTKEAFHEQFGMDEERFNLGRRNLFI
jgi:hypothetical protein